MLTIGRGDRPPLTGARLARYLLRAAGLAGVAGVLAGGVLLARDQRERAALSPEEIRARLQARHAEASGGAAATRPE